MIRYHEFLNDKEQESVLKLISDAAQQDGIPPIAEHVVLHLRHGGDKDDRHLILSDDATGEVIGYAHIDLTDVVAGSSAEFVIHPNFRGKGRGRALLSEILRVTSPRLWAHGDLESARNLAADMGLARTRTVIQMRRSLEIPLPSISTQVEIRSFLPGLDDEAWLELNNRIFYAHPEQGNWSLDNLHHRMKEKWFDPSGFLLGTQSSHLVAYCWTKIHGAHSHAHGDEPEHGHDPIGEIYAIGVDPSAEGHGIGSAMTIAGLNYLRYQGLNSAMLYVDAENSKALKLYNSLGFFEWGRDVMYKKIEN